MRYGLISDIHGNLEALNAVLKDLEKERIDTYLCVGDIVGYGANPKECIEIVRSLKPEVLIAGNHEWGVLGFLDLDYFNQYAREAVIWTKRILSHAEMEYLKSFKLTSIDKNITLVHGSLDEPKEFYYVFKSEDADPTLNIQKTLVSFVGHSHFPGIFRSDGGRSVEVDGMNTKIEPDKKYLINIGSIGQPRDGDPRAAFGIYDEGAGTVEIRRVDYNIEAAQSKILAAGLPPQFALRLALGN